jgi:hypothetical protein
MRILLTWLQFPNSSLQYITISRSLKVEPYLTLGQEGIIAKLMWIRCPEGPSRKASRSPTSPCWIAVLCWWAIGGVPAPTWDNDGSTGSRAPESGKVMRVPLLDFLVPLCFYFNILGFGLEMTAPLQYWSKIWLSAPRQFLIVLSQAIPAHFWIRYMMGSQDHIFYQNPLIQTNTALVMPLRNRKNDSNWDIVCFVCDAVIHLDAPCQVRLRYLSYPPAPFKRYYMAS